MATLQKLINQANDAPHNISDTNYLSTDATVGLVEEKNKEIDKSIQHTSNFFQQRIESYNASHSRKMENINKLINFIPKAKQIVDNKINFDNDINHIQMIKKAGEDYEADMLDSQAEELNNEYAGDYIDSETYESIPYTQFYTKEIHEIREKSLLGDYG